MSKYFKPHAVYYGKNSLSTYKAKRGGGRAQETFDQLAELSRKKVLSSDDPAVKIAEEFESYSDSAFTGTLAEFAYTNPSQSEIEAYFKDRTSSQLKGIKKTLKEKIKDGKAAIVRMEELAASASISIATRSLVSPQMILDRKAQVVSLENMYDIVGTLIDAKAFEEDQAEKDRAAIQRGYKSAEDAAAIRQVELEWYFKLYGTDNPIDVLAYQTIERKKYGITSYEAALKGQQLIEIGTIESADVARDAQKEKADIEADLLAAEMDKLKKRAFVFYGVGLAAVLGGAYYFFGRKK